MATDRKTAITPNPIRYHRRDCIQMKADEILHLNQESKTVGLKTGGRNYDSKSVKI